MMNSELNNHFALFANPLRTLRLLLFLVVFPLSSFAQNVEDYQQIAAENNPELRASFQQYLSSLEQEAQVGVLPDPELAFGYFISPIETRVGPQQARISLTQMFPWFGSLSDKRTLSQTRAKAQYEVFQENRNQLFFRVETTWLELYELNQSLSIAQDNLDILNSLVEISLRRHETDQASQVDVLRAQIEQEDLKSQIALLEDNRGVLIQKMSALLNEQQTASIDIPDTLQAANDIANKEALMEQVQRQNPALNRLRYQEDSSREMKKLAYKDGKPSFGIGLDYIFTGERDGVANLSNNGQDAIMARASFRIPLFRNNYNAKVREAELNIQSVQSQIMDKQNSLETDLESSLRDYYDAQRQYELYDQKQIQRVNQALSIMMNKYSTDSSNFEEILRMQRKLLDYQLSRVQALVDMKASLAYIDYLTGKNNINLKK
jgi:outer membrane protein TolC